MPSTLTMPKLSPTMEGGTIVKWHKKEGDAVKADDLLFEVATDKATVEYNSLDDGFLRKILVHENEEAVVNQAIAVFTETKGESIEGYEPEGLKVEEAPSEETVSEEAPAKGAIKAAPVAKATGLAQPAFEAEPPLEGYSFEFETSLEDHLPASPLAKKLAREKGLDITTVKGSGPGGRVMSRDLDLAQADAIATFGNRSIPKKAPGSYEEEPLSPMRKAIGQKLQASKTFIPHFYVQQDIDVEPMIASREQLKATGVKVTFNDFVMRAAALALKQHPTVNSGFDSVKNAIVRFKTIDISVAVSIDDGLITPIVRHVDYKNLGQISAEVKHLANLAKKGKLQPHEYRGGSFTVSNLGMFGIHDFQAVINPPQVSILAVGGVRDCAVVKNGQVVPGKRMMVSLSSDHRVVDGADAAKFLKTFQELLENPAILLI
ncbi:MAG: pyruvate dehydrogenase complex dihydrolipoamide acetyltransferase [Simkania sp.]|nr:pyruvate dehydrogenase complex dihydrolipoamide acetyltransferase [Simkania sp.]MCP5491349.1 pyruvate dehydrogenase complex dihydrolipoamide acetyltransferase [Chlamydiales bacterium]